MYLFNLEIIFNFWHLPSYTQYVDQITMSYISPPNLYRPDSLTYIDKLRLQNIFI